MEYSNQSQIASILDEIEYIMGLLGSTFSESARNTLMEQMRSLIRSIAELIASPAPWETMQENVEPQEDEQPSQPVAYQHPHAARGQEPVRLAETKRMYTSEELALYNGTNGYPSYVAVNGIVYDVSNAPIWQTSTHFGMPAGLDLSVEFNTCHSDKPAMLEKIIPVGRLESGE